MSFTDEGVVNLVHTYIRELNEELKSISKSDVADLFTKLCSLETQFSKKLRSTADGRKVYEKFVYKINRMKGGIKVAKPYFRERQDVFSETVNRAIRENKPEMMYDIPINYKFVRYAMENITKVDKKGRPVDPPKKIVELHESIKVTREQIISKYLHLALNKAKVFSKSMYIGYSDFSDILQLANEALVLAVDKYVVDDNSSSFHVMAIGRIVGHLIAYGSAPSSATIGLHNQKKLYQIRKLMQKNPGINNKEMAEILKIAEKEIDELIEATKYSSLDQPVNADMEDSSLGDFVADQKCETNNPHSNTEHSQLVSMLYSKMDQLSIIEQKVLKLKGIKNA